MFIMSSDLKRRPGKTPSPPAIPRGGGGVSAATPVAAASSPSPPTPAIFDNSPLWFNHQIIWGINAIGLLISWMTQSHVHLDLLGTGAFAVAALVPVLSLLTNRFNARIASSSAAVAVWATKLALFLFYRALHVHHDGRLTSTLSTASGAAGFWFISALWGVVVSLPHALGTTRAAHVGTPIGNMTSLAVFFLGWLIETVADLQKWKFKQQHHSAGEFCNVGLWQYSQHPNWFGNLVLWSGIFLLNAPALVEPTTVVANQQASIWQRLWSYRRVGLALLSPLFLWTLFSGQANGTITDSLHMANQKYGYGTNPEYTAYVDNTPLILPIPKRWGNSR